MPLRSRNVLRQIAVGFVSERCQCRGHVWHSVGTSWQAMDCMPASPAMGGHHLLWASEQPASKQGPVLLRNPQVRAQGRASPTGILARYAQTHTQHTHTHRHIYIHTHVYLPSREERNSTALLMKGTNRLQGQRDLGLSLISTTYWLSDLGNGI